MPENPERAPIATSDPINARILAVSEDRIQGYSRDPLAAIASEAGIPLPQVLERLRALSKVRRDPADPTDLARHQSG